jgi:MoaD family protein
MKHLKLFATLRDVVGAPTITVAFEQGTVRDLIGAIRQAHPALADQIVDGRGEMTGLVHIFVEGRNIDWLQHLDTHIAATDDVFLIPPVAGG